MAMEGNTPAQMQQELFKSSSNRSIGTSPDGGDVELVVDVISPSAGHGAVSHIASTSNTAVPQQIVQQIPQQPVQYVATGNNANIYYAATTQPAIVSTSPGVITNDSSGVPMVFGGTNNINFINTPIFQKAEYDENMQPWLNNEINFNFACYTSESAAFEHKEDNTIQAKQKQQSLAAQTGISVYHRKNSQRIIIKKRDHIGFLSMSKQSPVMKWGLGLVAIGVILIVLGINGATGMLIGGVLSIIIGVGLIFGCRRNSKAEMKKFEFTVQSIPLNSIHYVDRQLETASAAVGGGCDCCCSKPAQISIEYSEVTIGYNRGNVSSTFGVLAGLTVSEQDTIKLRLFSNHAYSLHQYLIGIMDGNNSINYNTENSRYIHYNVLPGR